jgi:hypothetical protein
MYLKIFDIVLLYFLKIINFSYRSGPIPARYPVSYNQHESYGVPAVTGMAGGSAGRECEKRRGCYAMDGENTINKETETKAKT